MKDAKGDQKRYGLTTVKIVIRLPIKIICDEKKDIGSLIKKMLFW